MPDVLLDGAGNVRIIQNKNVGGREGGTVGTVAYPAASYKMASALAGTANAVLTGVAGKRWLIEEARVILGSVAAAASVSLADGTTTYSITLGSAGAVGVEFALPTGYLAASGGTVTLGVGTAGAASSSTAMLKGRLVLAADY